MKLGPFTDDLLIITDGDVQARIGRTSGFVVMLELMKRLAEKADPPFKVATMNVPWTGRILFYCREIIPFNGLN